MKTQEQQKAELLTQYVEALIPLSTTVELNDMEKVLVKKYKEITSQKPLTADPYIDEVFSKRVYDLVNTFFWGQAHVTRLSHCPKLKEIELEYGFGRKSREEYIEVMRKYNFLDKI